MTEYKYICEPCNFKAKYYSLLETHKTRQKHFMNTGEIIIKKKYYCKPCDFRTPYLWHMTRHKNGRDHKKNVNPPEQKICSMCPYKSYDQTNFRRHLNKHKKKQTHIKRIKFKSKLDDHLKGVKPEEPDFIKDEDKIKEMINDILVDCKDNKIDPNKHFNYKYYALNINQLNILELNDFYQEIKTINVDVKPEEELLIKPLFDD